MPKLIDNWRNVLKFYSTWVLAIGGLLDIAVYGWTYAEGILPIGPLKYLAISLGLKALSLLVRIISQKAGLQNANANPDGN